MIHPSICLYLLVLAPSWGFSASLSYGLNCVNFTDFFYLPKAFPSVPSNAVVLILVLYTFKAHPAVKKSGSQRRTMMCRNCRHLNRQHGPVSQLHFMFLGKWNQVPWELRNSISLSPIKLICPAPHNGAPPAASFLRERCISSELQPISTFGAACSPSFSRQFQLGGSLRRRL